MGEMTDRVRSAIQSNRTNPRPPVFKKKKQRPSRARIEQIRIGARGRLPHGSVFFLTWDIERGLWNGKLIIGHGGPTLVTTHGGVFPILRKLDDLYRKWLSEHGPGR